MNLEEIRGSRDEDSPVFARFKFLLSHRPANTTKDVVVPICDPDSKNRSHVLLMLHADVTPEQTDFFLVCSSSKNIFASPWSEPWTPVLPRELPQPGHIQLADTFDSGNPPFFRHGRMVCAAQQYRDAYAFHSSGGHQCSLKCTKRTGTTDCTARTKKRANLKSEARYAAAALSSHKRASNVVVDWQQPHRRRTHTAGSLSQCQRITANRRIAVIISSGVPIRANAA